MYLVLFLIYTIWGAAIDANLHLLSNLSSERNTRYSLSFVDTTE